MSECSLCGCTQAGKHEEVARQDAEIAALTEHEAMRVENEAMTERFVPLVEENERLRAALREIADSGDSGGTACACFAEAALAQPAATGEGT